MNYPYLFLDAVSRPEECLLVRKVDLPLGEEGFLIRPRTRRPDTSMNLDRLR